VKIAILTTDSREHFRDYDNPAPYFGTAPEALLQGLALLPEVEVHVVSCLQQTVHSPEKIGPNIFYHAEIVPKWGWLRTGYQGCIRAIRKKLQEIRPDIVHGQGTERDCALAAIFSGFPNVVTIHGNMAELARLFPAPIGSYGWLSARLENFALRRTAGVFCNSAYTEGLVRPRARKTWRVANPLRSAFFDLPKPVAKPVRPVLLNVGHVGLRKRQVEWIRSAMSLKSRGVDFELHVVGKVEPADAYGAEFTRLVAEHSGWVKYLGEKKTDELIGLFDQSSALVHVPSEESFGLVVAEALARNLKLFGSATGGMVDIASGVEGAELFAPQDWAALENAIARWIENGSPRPVTAAAAMRERYHPLVIARRHLEIYSEVLGKIVES
jgi:glycosyltransferase involved in cell wall biosynthesis